MRAVVAAVAPDLKAAGFRKRRHSFNRTTEPGVVHVIDFQMWPYRVPPGSPVLPRLVDGSFRINLGVYVDAPVRESWQRPTGSWVSESQCPIRTVIGELLQGHDYDRRAVDPSSGTPAASWPTTSSCSGAIRMLPHASRRSSRTYASGPSCKTTESPKSDCVALRDRRSLTPVVMRIHQPDAGDRAIEFSNDRG
jgi:hypothetical protein